LSKVLLSCLLKRKELHCCEIVWMVLHCGHNKQDYSRMKNGGAVVEVWILLWTFSVCSKTFLLTFFAFSRRWQRQKILQFLPWSIFTLEATKDSNTCVETIIWWHYGGCARERVASFRRYCTIFSDFFHLKKRFRLKKETLTSLKRKKPKREASVATLATFLTRISKSENILLNCFDHQNSLDKYFWHPCQKVWARLTFHYSNLSLCVI